MSEWIEPEDIIKYPKGKLDSNGNPAKYRKHEFVLMDLKVFSGETEKERELVGWWTGSCWEGARLDESDKVLKWRKRYGI